MSYLLNDPASFVDEMIDGFVAANAGHVRRVSGGVVRASATPDGQVAVVIGGGSGHYPAFAGIVGPGLAHGAAMGNVFASPSAAQIYSVAKAVATEAGVLLSYGNYAGDVLNFDQAQERLIAEGIPCRTVTVTDDIYSASADERAKRRGIAGDFVVFRAAAWAAEQGRDLDAVWEAANAANERTRSIGVAFSGCTLPGADQPLFTVPEGRMAVGLGIHGEPGIDEVDMPTADELAEQLVSRLLEERPDGVASSDGARVAVILNGLGTVKYEELFVVYRRVAELLSDAGLTVVDPEVGELVTSFEMAGASLTLCWLTDELEEAWRSPVSTPAYKKGAVDEQALSAEPIEDSADEDAVPPASDASRQAAGAIVDVLDTIQRTIDEHADELGRLDSIAGDGDHGIGMQRGATAAASAARDAVAAGAGAGSTLALAGDAWADRAGGTSGALWGLGLRTAGVELGDEDAPTAGVVQRGVAEAAAAIARIGKAQPGDKTMLDALLPFAERLTERVEADAPLAEAWGDAAAHATEAANATADLLPKIGRARPHSEKSVGTPDPGAISLALCMTAIGELLTEGS